ncbi:MAG: family 65 glycosyl hydrolase [bacterium]|nr:family 65 glycosyl hydrolase [bacterium]
MITHPSFALEPWRLRETQLDLDVLAETESIFALSNGHIGLRANLDEGEPHGLLGSYLNAFYEVRPLPYPEGGYGYPEAGQTVVNVTDGKLIRLLVDDEPFDVRYGRLRRHERTLDFREGVLRREVEWEAPTGRVVRVRTTRLVSFTQRAVAAILYEVEPVDGSMDIVLQSELVTNEPLPRPEHDPRVGSALDSQLLSEWYGHRDQRVVLVHATQQSALRTAAGADHVVEGPDGVDVTTESEPDLGRFLVTATLKTGQRLRLVKFLAYGWSEQRTSPALRDQVEGALAAARHRGWDGLVAEQRSYLDEFWRRADVELEGDDELQHAVRFGLFHVLQSAVRAERRAIPAKGLTGSGYDGHTFWDTEAYVLPVLTYTLPSTVRDALTWRHSTLPLAQERARTLGLSGAAFPWRTIHGEECSGYWPAGTAAFHVNAAIAVAVERYCAATGDDGFMWDFGLEILVETARLWRSLGHHDRHGQFRIDGVTGPDEYSAVADNNVYTNLMAARNLRVAAEAVERWPERGVELGVDLEEAASWRSAGSSVVIPYDERLGVHCQSEGFTQHQRWDFERTRADQYPLLLHFPYFDIYRKQVVKQADLVLAMHVCGDAFTAEEKARNFAYYEGLTVRDSSLSACTQAVVAAEVGHLDLAYDYLGEAALMDLEDREHNVSSGVHMASLAGAWQSVVAGFGGMRDEGGKLSFAPRLPHQLERVRFQLLFQDRLLQVSVGHRDVEYRLLEGSELEIVHHGETVTVGSDGPTKRRIPHTPALKRPSQPSGRAPQARRSAGG